jgi:hypothetical protein
MFSFKRADKGNNPAIKEYPAAAGTYKVGDVAVLTNGYITKASGTTKPEYVLAFKGTVASGDIVAVNPIYADMEFDTTLSASGALKIGDKVTINSDSDKVTATTTNGVATLVDITGTASGNAVTVKFE